MGILALVATMSFLEGDTQDLAPAHGLAQLDMMARDVHASNNSGEWAHLCVWSSNSF